MICTFRKGSDKSDRDPSLVGVDVAVEKAKVSLSKNKSDNIGQGVLNQDAATEELIKVLESRQQALSVQSEKSNLICRTLQYQWLLIQKQLEKSEGKDSLYDNAYLMLEPEFQPISPATDIPESMRIFEEHKKLAKEYLHCRTEIECLLQAKKDLESQLREQEKYGPFGGQRDSQGILKEWRELKSENESLVQYHRNLKKQLEIIKSRKQPNSVGTQDFEPEPGWVMVSRKDNAPPTPE